MVVFLSIGIPFACLFVLAKFRAAKGKQHGAKHKNGAFSGPSALTTLAQAGESCLHKCIPMRASCCLFSKRSTTLSISCKLHCQ
eukprot:scaffold32931_cov58-Skeletonema_marinoi.AAC.1